MVAACFDARRVSEHVGGRDETEGSFTHRYDLTVDVHTDP